MQTVITDTVRISVQKTFNQGRNVGGSFEIKGYKCDTITEQVKVIPINNLNLIFRLTLTKFTNFSAVTQLKTTTKFLRWDSKWAQSSK